MQALAQSEFAYWTMTDSDRSTMRWAARGICVHLCSSVVAPCF
jgi:hypothetical protein